MSHVWKTVLFAIGLGVAAMVEAFTRGPSISFLNREDTRALLAADADGFVQSLTAADLSARRVRSNNEYMQVALDSAQEYTIRQQDRIRRLIEGIKMTTLPLEEYGMSPSKFEALPWKFALATYEDEFPHTRGDVIFLSPSVLQKTDAQLTKTLVHEKVHVYQKAYPEDVRAFVHVWGYREMAPRSMDARLRANPDLDGLVYVSRDGTTSGIKYRTKAPTAIDDITGDPKEEHPFEIIAYIVSKDR